MAQTRLSATEIRDFEFPPATTPADVDKSLGDYFKRVENLVWVKGQDNAYYRVVLEDCRERKKTLGDRLDRREKRSEELTNQIYNVVGFFSVFQGVILTAVSQLTSTNAQSSSSSASATGSGDSNPLCGKAWFPLVLSSLASVVASVGIALKFRQLHSIDLLIHDEKLQQREAEKRESTLLREGQQFKFSDIGDAATRLPESYWIYKAVAVIGAVNVFTVIFILSFFSILCNKFVIKGWQ